MILNFVCTENSVFYCINSDQTALGCEGGEPLWRVYACLFHPQGCRLSRDAKRIRANTGEKEKGGGRYLLYASEEFVRYWCTIRDSTARWLFCLCAKGGRALHPLSIVHFPLCMRPCGSVLAETPRVGSSQLESSRIMPAKHVMLGSAKSRGRTCGTCGWLCDASAALASECGFPATAALTSWQ